MGKINSWGVDFFTKFKYEIIAFCVAFIPRFLLIFGMTPLRTVTDEMITIAGAAYLSGLDWSALLSFSGRYYGSGFTMLFAWIFKLTDDPIVIYRVFLVGCVCVQALVSIICFDIMYNGFKLRNKKYVCLASIACSYCVVTRATIVYNEHILILISWIIACILVKLADLNLDKKKKMKFSVVLMAMLVYSLTVHARSYTYWISTAIVFILFFWTYRKSLLSIRVILGGCIGGIGIYGILEMLKKGMYLIQEGQSLSNTKVSVSGIQYLRSVNYWEGWLNIVVGQVSTITVFTGGMILIGLIIGVILLWNGLLRRRSFVPDNQDINIEIKYWIICVFFGASIVMTIFAQSLSWLGYVGDAMMGISEQGVYPFKAFTYVRYFGPYCGPVFMVVLTFLYQFKEKVTPFFKVAFSIMCVLEVYWVMVILPRIYNNKYPVEVFLPFSLWNFADTPRLRTYLAGTVVLLCIFAMVIFLFYKNKKNIIAALTVLLLMYQYVYNAFWFDGAFRSNSNYEMCIEGYNLVKSLEKNTELPRKIYVVEGRNIDNQQIFYEYQFLLNNYCIIPGLPTEELSEGIILSNTDLGTMDNYQKIVLDEDSFAYIKGIE